MTDEQRPPQSIWLDDDAVADHFDTLRAKNKATAQGGADWEDIPSEQNEITKRMKG